MKKMETFYLFIFLFLPEKLLFPIHFHVNQASSACHEGIS